MLKPRGGGTRRRASDAVRLGLAVLLVAVSVPLIRANLPIEIKLDQLFTPLPAVTAYLPLIWGWATLVWMRHREYI